MAIWSPLICVLNYKVVFLATMSEDDIKERFAAVVQDNALMKKIGASKFQRYHWRNPDKQDTKVGTMLEVLWKLDKLSLKNE